MVVAIITYKRPNMLKNLLEALEKVHFDTKFDIVIIDNDKEESAYRVYENLMSLYTNRLHYFVESKKGLSNARNRAVQESFKISDYMVFIDDDEIPDPLWLKNIVSYQSNLKAPVVVGPVRVKLECKDKIIDESCFRHQDYSGPFIKEGGRTGNCLITREVIDRIGLPLFDADFNTLGGEDSAFFSLVHKKGIRVGWAPDAIVTEIITKDRINLRYVIRKNFFRYSNYTQIILKSSNLLKSIAMTMVRSCLYMSLGTIKLILSVGLIKKLILGGLMDISHGAGNFYGIFGLKKDLYEKTTGD